MELFASDWMQLMSMALEKIPRMHSRGIRLESRKLGSRDVMTDCVDDFLLRQKIVSVNRREPSSSYDCDPPLCVSTILPLQLLYHLLLYSYSS
jgi:hypothetical protein